MSDKKSDNPYSIDYFIFDEIQNVYICHQKQILMLDGVYDVETRLK